MRFTIIFLITFLSAGLLMGQSSKTLISNIEKSGKNKSRILAAMEAEILKITQQDFPSWNITGVTINPTTGVLTVQGVDNKGKSFSHTGKKFADDLASPSYQPPASAKSSMSYSNYECLRRWLAGLSCDPWIDATNMSIPYSDLDAVEKKCRDAYLVMMTG